MAPFWHRWSYFSIINLSVFHLADKCFTITNLINLQIILFLEYRKTPETLRFRGILRLDTTLSYDNKSIFRLYYSIIVATRPDPTVRPPSRYFNPVFPYIFHIFLYILNRLIRITKYQLETPIQKTIYIPNLLLKNSYDMYMSMHLNQIMLYYMRLYQMYCNILLHHNHKTLQNH